MWELGRGVGMWALGRGVGSLDTRMSAATSGIICACASTSRQHDVMGTTEALQPLGGMVQRGNQTWHVCNGGDQG
jgi:hypothetical protein